MANLYVTHRPQTVDEIVGNEVSVQSLRNLFSKAMDGQGKVPHAFLFHGPSGCGKTTFARIIASGLGCQGMDLTEVDTGDFRGIDTIRDIRSRMHLKPMESPCRVWIIDEAHRATGDAQSALLKALEDTPPHVFFVLCTTDPEKLLATIRNRCTQFQVTPLKDREIMELLRTICKKEEWSIGVDVMKQIAKASQGSPRMALVLLDKIQGLREDQIEIAIAEVLVSEAKVVDLCRALVDKKKDWVKIMEILEGLKNENPESLRLAIIGYFSKVIRDKNPNYGAWWAIDCFYRNPTYNIGMAVIWKTCFEVVFVPTGEGN